MGDLIRLHAINGLPESVSRTPEVNVRSSEPSTRSLRPEPLWREVAGAILRDRRLHRAETQTDVATRAGISMQYLSEIERGRKEPSSEVLAAVAGALEISLADLTLTVAQRLRPLDDVDRPRRITPGRPTGPVALAA